MTDQPEPVELTNILCRTQVGELSLRSHPNVESSATVAEAIAAMRQQKRGSATVCRDGRLVGVLTERDLLRLVDGGKSMETPLSEAMTPQPQTITTEETLMQVIRLMNEGGYRRLPVLDGAGVPVGIVDVKTIVHFLVEHYSATVYNQASHAQLTAKDREGA